MDKKGIAIIFGGAGFVLGAASMAGFLYFSKDKVIENKAEKLYEDRIHDVIEAYKRRDAVIEKHEKPDISEVANNLNASPKTIIDIVEKEVDKTLKEATEMIEKQQYTVSRNVFDDIPTVVTSEVDFDASEYTAIYYTYTFDGYLINDANQIDDDAMADITPDILQSFANDEEAGEMEVLRGGRHYIITKSLGTYREIVGKEPTE